MRENPKDVFLRCRIPGKPGPVVSSVALPLRISASRTGADYLAILLSLACGTGFIILAGSLHVLESWIELFRSMPFLRLSSFPLFGLILMALTGSAFRTILWVYYKPDVPEGTRKIDWPHVTVILSALNEEGFIEQAVDSVFASRYPKDRLDIVCVNDGSGDGTLARMKKSQDKYGSRVTIINFRKNLGKRKAISSALKKSQGEVVITFDSDSKLDRSAIRNVVIPLLKDEKTGAVAGHVAVLNENENFLTRMLACRYLLSFDYGRAYQSVYGGVFCCPGALAAFRRDVFEEVAGDWLAQTFMKSHCRQGEDMALTTLILKAGYLVKYQSNALVYTKVPGQLRQVHRMYLRWTRSYIRESVVFAKFMFLPTGTKHRILPILDFVFLSFLHPFHLVALAVVTYSLFIEPLLVMGTLGILAVFSFLFSLSCLKTGGILVALYGTTYAFMAAFTQWWIVPYSVVTVKDQSWLTR
jgi:hyaluronan synthase